MISQTPRLEAKKLCSPILGPFEQDNVKRAISAFEQDYDLLGLSQNKAYDEDSLIIEHGLSMNPYDEFPNEQRKQEGLKQPF